MNQWVYLELLLVHYQCPSFEEWNTCRFHPLWCLGLGRVRFRFIIILPKSPETTEIESSQILMLAFGTIKIED
jgi:hypothetical protein